MEPWETEFRSLVELARTDLPAAAAGVRALYDDARSGSRDHEAVLLGRALQMFMGTREWYDEVVPFLRTQAMNGATLVAVAWTEEQLHMSDAAFESYAQALIADRLDGDPDILQLALDGLARVLDGNAQKRGVGRAPDGTHEEGGQSIGGAARSSVAHLCPSLHCAGMLASVLPGALVWACTESISHGPLLRTFMPLVMVNKDLPWTDRTSADHREIFQDGSVFGAVCIWCGDALDEQLFAAQMVAACLATRRPEQVRICHCATAEPRAVAGMAGMNPTELLRVASQPLTETDAAATLATWRAITGPDPDRLNAAFDGAALPRFLSALPALRPRYPSCRNGLEIWEDWLLREFIEVGPEVNAAVSRCIAEGQASSSDRVDDTKLLERIHGLADERNGPPLLTLTHEAAFAHATSLGRQIAAGTKNRLDVLRGERWVGGVRLGPDNRWCFANGSVRRYGG